MFDLESYPDLRGRVKQVLRHFHDLAYLGQHAPTAWRLVWEQWTADGPSADPIAAGQAVQALLSKAIEALKPDLPLSFTAPEWRAYHLLDRVFRQGDAPQHVYAHLLNISRSHYYRELDAAIAKVADLLSEWEWQARHTPPVTGPVLGESSWAARLPPPTYTRLFGVDPWLDTLAEALHDPARRWLVVVDGLGGVGKTALARQAACHALEASAFVDLAWETAQQRVFCWGQIRDTREPALTVDRLLDGLALQMGRPHLARWPKTEKHHELQATLRQEPRLIVVDNLETAEDYQAIAEALWTLANPSKVLVTSRHRLDHYDTATAIHLGPLDRAAGQAFIRYHAAERGVPAIDGAGEDTVTQVYRATGGNPLAIKLVVGQAASRPLTLILEHLSQAQGDTKQLYRFVYRAAWQMLSPSARQVLLSMPHLSIRGGPWEAIAAISALGGDALLQAMDELITLSLLDVGGTTEKRYSIHQLTRNFVLSDLVGLEAEE